MYQTLQTYVASLDACTQLACTLEKLGLWMLLCCISQALGVILFLPLMYLVDRLIKNVRNASEE